jgi:hypothetical protein
MDSYLLNQVKEQGIVKIINNYVYEMTIAENYKKVLNELLSLDRRNIRYSRSPGMCLEYSYVNDNNIEIFVNYIDKNIIINSMTFDYLFLNIKDINCTINKCIFFYWNEYFNNLNDISIVQYRVLELCNDPQFNVDDDSSEVINFDFDF